MTSEKPADAPEMGAPPPYTPGAAGPPPTGIPYPAPPPGFNLSDDPYPASTAYPPQPGMPQPGANPYMQQTVVPPAPQTITVTSHQAPMVAIVNQCPNCKVGSLQEQFTPFGILCAIFFFPFGILCCLMSRHKICPVCGTIFHGR
ncbi:membrane protein BRI3-like isoform X1 [Lytechinus pictus]|uniref:membrane protein BRI3-like isoform X1 n=1 Tax=Lytechinus pictus TaxID=7653 RepID=UPI00240E20D8|nr:brain protein I3-like isoform X1 [Lytechinus pictus]